MCTRAGKGPPVRQVLQKVHKHLLLKLIIKSATWAAAMAVVSQGRVCIHKYREYAQIIFAKLIKKWQKHAICIRKQTSSDYYFSRFYQFCSFCTASAEWQMHQTDVLYISEWGQSD